MKLFFLTLLIILSIGFVLARAKTTNIEPVENVYQNPDFNYQIDLPAGYKLDDLRIELVSLFSDSGQLRINAGCFDYGTEKLTRTIETVEINGVAALKESFYSDSILKLIRFSLTRNDQCFYLELYSQTEIGWQDLKGLVRSFRIH